VKRRRQWQNLETKVQYMRTRRIPSLSVATKKPHTVNCQAIGGQPSAISETDHPLVSSPKKPIVSPFDFVSRYTTPKFVRKKRKGGPLGFKRSRWIARQGERPLAVFFLHRHGSPLPRRVDIPSSPWFESHVKWIWRQGETSVVVRS
jgi:hypothetical protein